MGLRRQILQGFPCHAAPPQRAFASRAMGAKAWEQSYGKAAMGEGHLNNGTATTANTTLALAETGPAGGQPRGRENIWNSPLQTAQKHSKNH